MLTPYLQDMLLIKRGVDTVVVTDRGNDVYAETPLPMAAIYAPAMLAEGSSNGENTVPQTPTVYLVADTGLPDGVAVEALDVIQIGAERFEVDGQPVTWGPSPLTNWQPGTEVRLHRVGS